MATLGIAILRTGVHGVVTTRGRVIRSAEAAIGDGESVTSSLDRILSVLLTQRRWKPRVVVALGPAFSQVKRLDGIPSGTLKTLSRVVQQNARSFFIRSTRSIVSNVSRIDDGTAWAAAFDADLVDEVRDVLRQHGLLRVTLVASTVATAGVLPSGVVRWTTASGDLLPACRLSTPLNDAVELPSALSELGIRYLNAYAAAQCTDRVPCLWSPAPDSAALHARDRWRLASAVALVVLMAALALFAPGIVASRTVAQTRTALAASRASRDEGIRVQRELSRVSAQLATIDRFKATRGRMTMLLADIAQAIPESTAILLLHVDTLEGNVVAIATRAADILPQLATVGAVVNPRIVGAVTRETQGAVRLERATIRFRRRRDFSPPSRTLPATTASR